MLVEFECVVIDSLESFERIQMENISGENSVPFYRERDYKSTVVVDLNTIVGWNVGGVWYNTKKLNCIYAYDSEGIFTENLLIEADEFKKIYELTTGKKVFNWREI